MDKEYSQEEIINHLKSVGFFFQNSEIYGGLSNSWDYGPLGSILKKNIKDKWWDYFVTKKSNIVAIDSSIILNQNVWKASGHLDNFSDPFVDCKNCKNRFRADKLINDFFKLEKINENSSLIEMDNIINNNKLKCPNCNFFSWTKVRNFNLMFETYIGTIIDKKNIVYLRPETAQGIFLNFKNIQRTTRKKIPFGVAQIGKAFRNEITPSNFIYRSREFEQMEIEFFTDDENGEKFFNLLLDDMMFFLEEVIGISNNNLKLNEYKKNEIAHYSKKTTDIFFKFPHGWSELCGISNRGDFDLKNHSNASNKELDYYDEIMNKKFYPTVIEPSIGLDRLIYATLVNSFFIEELENDSRIILKIDKKITPYRCCVLPLTNKLREEAKNLFDEIISLGISCSYDESGSIGKRYRRQDAIGTFECITYDFDSKNDQKITIRNRDTMNQERISIDELKIHLRE